MANVRIIPFDPARHQHLFPSIVTLHADAIERDDIPLRFHPPFDEAKRAKMTAFWKQHTRETAEGRRLTLIALAGESDEDSGNGGSKDDGNCNGNSNGNLNGNGSTPIQRNQVLGIVELALSDSEAGTFRGELEMLIVSPSYRRHGLAKRLLQEVERLALEQNKTLITFSTTRDSVAEKYLYAQMGFVEFGRLPNYAITPLTGKYVDGVYFYKDLSRRARKPDR
ncbi:hypothetical protein E4U54_000751 [Claviceps lovelessii]|nr:hypothetical protein E4U54_000751 [Claviceps lovelessii]